MIPSGLAGVPDLLSELTGKFSQLFRAELRLAQAEMKDKAVSAAAALVPTLIGAVLLVPALVVLLQAAAAALVEQGMSPATSLLVVGVVGLVLAGILVWLGLRRLARMSATPHRTVRQVQRDVALAKQQTGVS